MAIHNYINYDYINNIADIDLVLTTSYKGQTEFWLVDAHMKPKCELKNNTKLYRHGGLCIFTCDYEKREWQIVPIEEEIKQ